MSSSTALRVTKSFRLGMCGLILCAGASQAQRTFTVRVREQLIATERVVRVGDTLSIETTMVGQPVVFRSRLALSGGRIQAFDGEVVTPSATQRARLSIDGDSATLTWTRGTGAEKTLRLLTGRDAPVMVFQNFLFAMMEPVLAPIASSRGPSHVRVLLPEKAVSQVWAIERDRAGALVLVVPDGPRMIVRFSGGRLIGLEVPSQGLVMRAQSAP